MKKFIVRSIKCKTHEDMPSALERVKSGEASLYSTPVHAESAEKAQLAFATAYEGQAIQFSIMAESDLKRLIIMIDETSTVENKNDNAIALFGVQKKQLNLNYPTAKDLIKAEETGDIFITIVRNTTAKHAIKVLNEQSNSAKAGENYFYFGFITRAELKNELELIEESSH